MTDREDRSDRLQRRFEHGNGNDGDEAGDDESPDSGASGASSTGSSDSGAVAESGRSETDEESLKDRPSVLMYLPEETRRELDIRFDELNARYKREYGEPLEKNRDYYPAVVRAALEGEPVEEVLGL